MMVPGETAAELQAKATKSPVYFAKFQYSGANTWKLLFDAESVKGRFNFKCLYCFNTTYSF